jgi:hypothetical protein
MKKKRNSIKEIIKYKQENLSKTLQEIGNHFGFSRQYIHTVLKQNNISTFRVPSNIKLNKCLVCGDYSKTKIHEGSCTFKYYNIKIECAFCKIPFYRKRAEINTRRNYGYKKIFCGLKCYNKSRGDKGYEVFTRVDVKPLKR